MALRLNTSEKNEIMPRRKARAEKPRLAQMLLRSGSLAGVESLHGRPDRSGSLRSTDLQSLSLSLSRPHLANDEAHALYHGYACSESTSASLRPKPPLAVLAQRPLERIMFRVFPAQMAGAASRA